MWTVMMVAMMLPALAPMLLRYQRAVKAVGAPRLAGLTIVVAVAYFLVWTAFGLAVYPAGVALAEAAMTRSSLARATPLALGLVVMFAGLLQFTAWKARQLDCCRAMPAQGLRAGSLAAFRHGLLLGIRCIRCCLGPTAILLVLGSWTCARWRSSPQQSGWNGSHGQVTGSRTLRVLWRPWRACG